MDLPTKMTEATFAVCDYYIQEERRHFCENLTSEERADKELFVKRFKEHILYSLLVLLSTGDEEEIAVHIDELWDEEGYGVYDCDEGVCDDMVVTGIRCRKCDTVLPPHTMSEHLDVTNKIHECPHVVRCDSTGCIGGRA